MPQFGFPTFWAQPREPLGNFVTDGMAREFPATIGVTWRIVPEGCPSREEGRRHKEKGVRRSGYETVKRDMTGYLMSCRIDRL